MTREEFMTRLRRGLVGLPAATAVEIAEDYETHFADGLANGRSEAEVAEALGNPDKLARDLRAEAGLRRWEEDKSPAAARGALWALLGLGALDLFILTTVLAPVLGILLAMLLTVVAGIGGGAVVLTAGPFADPPGGPTTAILAGIGLISVSISLGALLGLICVGLVNALIWYARLHYRLLKPAIEPQA
jgi:uncharacterized membrane protein